VKQWTIFIICILYSSLSYGSLATKIFPELNLFKADIAKNADSLIKANTEIARNADALMKLTLQVGNIEANAKANASAIAGVNNKINQTNQDLKAGGNITQTSGASDSLIQFIFGKWYLFLGAFMTFFGTLIAQYERLLSAKDKQIQKLMESEETKDAKSDEWFRKYLESVTGHKTNGISPGQQEAKQVFDDTIKDIEKEGVKK
jgi:hypothetical protein